MKFIVFSILTLVLILVIKPLTIPGFFPIHDDTQVARVYEMQKALDDGMFPVRWSKDLGYGYGYPVFNFYAPLSYYVGGVESFFGVDPIVSTKTLFALALIFSAISMYILGSFLWGVWGGTVSSVLYVLAPYNALNIFVRGNVAEAWAYSFIPLFFYGLFRIYKEKKIKLKYVVVSSLSLSAIILSHNLTAFELSIFFFITLIFFFLTSRKQAIKFSLLSFVLGLLIASFYFIPAIFESSYTNIQSQIGGGADFKNHFVCIQQLWDSPWGYGGSAPGCLDGLSFRIGKLHLVLLGLFVLVILKNWKRKKEELNFLILAIFVFSLFFMIDISKPIWEFIKPMEYIQYPWRFLTFASFSTALIAGSLIKELKDNLFKFKVPSYLYGSLIIVIALALYVKLFSPQTVLSRSSFYYTNIPNLNFKISKISDEYLPKDIQKPQYESEVGNKMQFLKGSGKVVYLDERTNSIKTFIDSGSDSTILFRLAFFPAWKAYVDNKEVELKKNTQGITLELPQGAHDLTLKFVETPVERASDLLSLSGVSLLILGTIYAKKKRIW